MSQTTVVNQKFTTADVYIGHGPGVKGMYGNPFVSKQTKAPNTCKVDNAEMACVLFRAWLTGCDPSLVNKVTRSSWLGWQTKRRQLILANLWQLSGCSLGCFCVTPRNKTPDCHGFVLAELADRQAQVKSWLENERPIKWTFEGVQALGWLHRHDTWQVADGFMIKPWDRSDIELESLSDQLHGDHIYGEPPPVNRETSFHKELTSLVTLFNGVSA